MVCLSGCVWTFIFDQAGTWMSFHVKNLVILSNSETDDVWLHLLNSTSILGK